MIKENIIEIYKAYHEKIGDRKPLYHLIARTFNIQTALYPGSHIDITPSLVIPNVIYIDQFKGAIKFFKHMDQINAFIDQNKHYQQPCHITFKGEDYTSNLNINPVDLIISQYAGFVGQATKKYLKKGGILLCNDSHGDATLARCDHDFEFIGVVVNHKISNEKLDKYFKLSKDRSVNLKQVRETMKGPKYKITATNYVFKKI